MVAVMFEREGLKGLDDAALVKIARMGGENAIRELIRRNNQRLFRVARSVMRDDAEAEDVVQEAYVRAFTALDDFREESRFSTWLVRIALNEAFRRLRKRRATTDLPSLDTAVGGDPSLTSLFPLSLVPLPADSEADRTQMRTLLERTIDRLPENFRIVFMLRDIEGLSIEETAAHLSIKAETVKTRQHRARRMLRVSIEEQLHATFSDLYPFDGERCVLMADRVIARLTRTGLD